MDPVSKAQQDAGNSTKRVIGRPFPKGVSGNPSGRPKKLEITKIYEQILRSTDNKKAIKDSVLSVLKSKRMATVLLLREMAERTEGKVTQPVDMEVSGKLTLESVLEARKKAGK